MWQIQKVKSVDSTNDEIRRLALEGADEGLVVVASEQQKGRGRQGREWISPAGKNLYCSLLLKPTLSTEKIAPITLLIGVAVAEALSELTSEPIELKWPNDLILNKRKLGGILTELEMCPKKSCSVIVGIGVNVNMSRSEFPDDLQEIATSLLEETSATIEHDFLLSTILAHIETWYQRFLNEGLDVIVQRYLDFSPLTKERLYEYIASGDTDVASH